MKNLIICFVLGVFIFAFGNSSFAGGSVTVQWRNGEKAADVGAAYKKKGGPPPHAPAHGYRAKHKYRYYPCCDVYHDIGKGVYFYLRGENWEVGASLPTNLSSGGLGGYVSLELDTEKPYEQHAEHVKQYSKEKFKAPKQGKVANK